MKKIILTLALVLVQMLSFAKIPTILPLKAMVNKSGAFAKKNQNTKNGSFKKAGIFTINSCWHTTKTAFYLDFTNPYKLVATNPPTAIATQVYAGTATLADLTVTGTAIKWYAGATGGTTLTTSTTLVNGATYYASQTIASVESTRISVTVRKISEATQSVCAPATISSLLSSPSTGYTVQWFTSATGGTPITAGTPITTGTYYVNQMPPAMVSTLAGGYSGFADGIGTAAKFSSPIKVAAGADGNLYVSDYENDKIRKITPAGEVTTIAGSTFGYVDGTGTATQFWRPTGITMDASGNLYVAEYSNNKIRKITTAGVVTTFAGIHGTLGNTQGYVDGVGTIAQFNGPFDVAIDINGNVYVADTNNNKIRKITPTGVVSTLAGSTQGFADGTGTAAQFYQPYGIATDIAGNVYVADFGNHKIRKITPTGVVTTLAGSTQGFADGTGSNSKFNCPYGIVVDPYGNLIVADYNNNKIRKVTPAGVVTSIAGNITYGYADGTSYDAYFSGPSGVALDADGNIYVADSRNQKIRKITQGTTESNRVAVNVIVNTVSAPTSLPQNFCYSGTIADLTANGTSLKWYSVATNGTVLTASTPLTTGTYYVSQTTNGCESDRTSTSVAITNPSAPTASSQTFCGVRTVSDLVATGTNLKWYSVATNGTALSGSTVLATGNYYVSQTLNNCESTRRSVAVTVNSATSSITPTFNQVAAICSGGSLSPLPTFSTNFISGTWSPALNSLATTTYTFTPSSGQCVNTATMTITVNVTPTPTASNQSFCGFGKVYQLVATGTAIRWYSAASGGFELSSNDFIFTAATYYATQTLNTCQSARKPVIVSINSPVTPTFNQVPDVCAGTTISALPTTSLENIPGTWSPALDSTATTDYYFQPDNGQCAMATGMTINVLPSVTPTFTQVSPIFSGASLSALPTTSNNGVKGTWSPALNNTATTTYTFTPAAGQCGTTANMTITVNANSTPTFTQVSQICSGASLSALPTTSSNNISGSWSPALNNLATTTYTFTPTAGQNATTASMTIVVNPNTTPTFTAVSPICQGATLSALPTTSNNSITGTWSPALNNAATTTYSFMPTSGQCATSTTLAINVITTAAPTASNQSVCLGTTVAGLAASGTNIKWYNVASGGASLAGTTSLVAGNYYASQTLNGCESLSRKTITVSLGGTTLGNVSAISGSSNVCGITTTTYSVTPLAGATNYIWSFPAGISPISSIGNQVTVSIDSSFESGSITVKANSVCGYSANTSSISLSKILEIGGILGSPTSCGISTTTYSVGDAVGATFNWTTPQGISIISGQGTSSVMVTFDNTFVSGTPIIVKATNNCGTSIPRRLVIYSAQKPNTVSGPQHVCNKITTTYSTPAIAGTNFNWTPPANMTIISGQGTNSIMVSIDSNFEQGDLSVTASNNCGASEPYVLLISKTKAPKVIFGPKILCGNIENTYNTSGTLLNSDVAQVTYYVTNVLGATNYTWTVPTGASIVSGQGTNTIVASFNIINFVNGLITVTADTYCGTSAPTTLAVSRTLNKIIGSTNLCSLTSTTYSVPNSIGSNFVWSVPSWMSITSGINTNSIDVTIANPACKEVLTLNYISSCGTQESISINVGCNEYIKVASNLCGTTLPTVSSIISTNNLVYSAENYIQGITKYKFRVTDGTSTNYYESTNGKFRISNLASWNYGTTYTIDIALQINGIYKAYGCSCTVSTPPFTVVNVPITKLKNTFCGTTLQRINTRIAADFVSNASSYRFEITSNGQTTIYNSTTYNFRLTYLPGGANYSTRYSIRVAVLVNGIYGDYGISCDVITPNSGLLTKLISNEDDEFTVSAAPNPFENKFSLKLEFPSQEVIKIYVYDMIGKLVETKEFNASEFENISLGQNYGAGIYYVLVAQGLNSTGIRLVKK